MGGVDIVLAGGKAGADDPVAELQRCRSVIIDVGCEDPLGRASAIQERNLGPADVVDANLEGRGDAGRSGGADVGQQRLLEGKALVRSPGVAARAGSMP